MAAPPNEFARYCCDLLIGAGPCVARRMFGGYGISTNGLTLALLADLGGGEKLWLKADEASRPLFEAAGCERFVYLAKGKTMSMNYYSAPDDAMESPQLMAPWARLALEAALKARQAKPAAKRPVKPKSPSRPKAGIKTGIKAG
ncbi:MAG: TfoX/Sxy family protein [Rhodoferax sp.]|uniref:TfoX/Sxy family protein n=1 Tax=Rhodoferax sp. TaxID=50421 RepID=UPI00271B3BE6|nr:TfoX/Sxy family protein [Rhodoferax sp.]MDO8449895.1 TfoX/Sxy family protein [Rhodoferax sp.]